MERSVSLRTAKDLAKDAVDVDIYALKPDRTELAKDPSFYEPEPNILCMFGFSSNLVFAISKM